MANRLLWLWDDTNKQWLKAQCDTSGRLIVDPSAIFEDDPTDGETSKGPTSNWAYDWSHASGSSFPSSPIVGQFWLHTPTGRAILYQYYNAAWNPVMSFGTMTVYVDKTDGTDDRDHGTGVDSDAFATIQYAIDQIPPSYGGNVKIYLNAETYNESIVIRGKRPSGDYTITIIGTLSSTATGTIGAGSVQGNGAVQGTLVDSAGGMGVDAYANLLLYDPTTNDDYKVIDSNTATTFTVVGAWQTGAPAQNDSYTVYGWGTEIDLCDIEQLQQGVSFENIKFLGSGTEAFNIREFANVDFNRCCFTGSIRTWSHGYGDLDNCYVDISSGADVSSRSIFIRNNSYLQAYDCKLANGENNGTVVRVESMSFFNCNVGTIIEGYVDGVNLANYGLYVSRNSFIAMAASAANGYTRVRNCDVGIYALIGGKCDGTVNVQYSGNTVDESADAASFGYID